MSDPQEHRLTVTRTARFYTVGEFSPAITDVWVACHGYGQLAGPFARYLMPIAAPTRLIIAPEALNHYYTNHAERAVGASWMTREDRLTQIDDYVRYLDELFEHVTDRLEGADNLRVRVLGFSQGVHTAARWVGLGTVRPDQLIAWGSPLPTDLDLGLLRGKLDQPLVLVYGTEDEYLNEDALAAEQARLTQAGIDVETVTFDGGHRLDKETLRHLAER